MFGRLQGRRGYHNRAGRSGGRYCFGGGGNRPAIWPENNGGSHLRFGRATRARQVLALGVDYVCVHTAVDVQASGISPLSDFQRVLETVPPERVAIAGGIRLSTLDGYLIHKPAIVVMGGALYNAPDVRKAIGEVQERIQSYAGR